jgi:hypothetical protein
MAPFLQKNPVAGFFCVLTEFFCMIQSGHGRKKRKGTEKKRIDPIRIFRFISIRFDRYDTNQSTKMENENSSVACLDTNQTDPIEIKTQIQNADDILCPSQKNCMICNSPAFFAVNKWRRAGKTLREISALLKDEFEMDVSKDAVNRHFRRYNELMRSEVSVIAFEEFKRESKDLATHQKETLFLMSFAFQELLRRIENGTLHIDIEDYERLTKMYYQVLNNPSQPGDLPDVVEWMVRATKYPKINQASLDLPSN